MKSVTLSLTSMYWILTKSEIHQFNAFKPVAPSVEANAFAKNAATSDMCRLTILSETYDGSRSA